MLDWGEYGYEDAKEVEWLPRTAVELAERIPDDTVQTARDVRSQITVKAIEMILADPDVPPDEIWEAQKAIVGSAFGPPSGGEAECST